MAPPGARRVVGGTSKIELLPFTVVPRFSKASANDSTKNNAASTAVVRVSRLAVPRPDMNAPMPWRCPPPGHHPLAALDQHYADQGKGYEQVDDKQDGGHASSKAAV